MKMKMKRFVLFLLSALMIIGAIPLTAFADVDEDEDESIP